MKAKFVNEVAKEDRVYTIETSKDTMFGNAPTRYYYQTGTLAELIKAFSYTLEVGKSWEREKGNRKIDMNPKTVQKLVDNLYNASNNAAANGYSGKTYRVMEEGEPRKK
jgi:hypothetical protein